MHIKRFLFTALVLFALVGLASAEQVCTESEYKGRTIQKCRDTGSPGGGSFSDSFTDPRDGQTYRTVQIGNQIWMAENLNYRKAVTATTTSPPTAKSTAGSTRGKRHRMPARAVGTCRARRSSKP